MNPTVVDKIAQAVLYEGYVLYPYRALSVKNRSRWTFGGLYPKAYSDATAGSDRWFMQAQCLLRATEDAAVRSEIRFLHVIDRTTLPPGERWQEAAERKITLEPVSMRDLLAASVTHPFDFPSQQTAESAHDSPGTIIREQYPLAGAITISADRHCPGVFGITVRVENRTEMPQIDGIDRNTASLRSLASTHMIMSTTGGEFVSLADPPPELSNLAAACENIGCWPVLVGDPGERDTMLVSPIILYDYPQVAAESPGDLFDGTEIDEILSLRILTLTDQEKRQAAANDERVRQLLARTDALAQDQLLSLHGTIRGERSEAHHV